MNNTALPALVEFYLPILATAGDYARRIQNKIGRQSAKDGANAWTRALTDADLMVQHFVEIQTLAHYPQIGFYGEEHKQSPNTRYFRAEAETIVHLDPINGTFLYQHQRTGWDIVLGIRQQNRLMAAISYMPAHEQFYLAVDGLGALTGDRRCRRLRDFAPLQTRSGSRLCMTYDLPDIQAKIAGEFDCFDIVRDDDPARGIDNLNDLFSGKLEAFMCRQGELLDWGTSAYIVTQAGGCANHLDGSVFDGFENFDPQRTADMLVSSSPAVQKRLLELINDSG